jgi:hypothetical protein
MAKQLGDGLRHGEHAPHVAHWLALRHGMQQTRATDVLARRQASAAAPVGDGQLLSILRGSK